MKKKLMLYPVLFAGMLSILLIGCRKGSTVVPVVTLKSVTDISGSSAVTGGVITNYGEVNLIDCGVCFNLLPNPAISNNIICCKPASANFQVTIQGLNPNCTYYVRAYAANSAGTVYSEQSSFTTLKAAPLISTADLTNVTDHTATGGGNIRSDGGEAITACGVCWSTNHDPTVADSKTSDGSGSGSFSSSITGLTAGTMYFIRAYATNSLGTAYGNEVVAHCPIPIILTGIVNSLADPKNSFNCTYNIHTDGGSGITARGVCVSTNSNPTIMDSKTNDGTGIGTFTSNPLFISDISGLYSFPATIYFRAYVTNSYGTFYGNRISYTITYNPFNPPGGTL